MQIHAVKRTGSETIDVAGRRSPSRWLAIIQIRASSKMKPQSALPTTVQVAKGSGEAGE
jgi:hypothetical protein